MSRNFPGSGGGGGDVDPSEISGGTNFEAEADSVESDEQEEGAEEASE